MHVLCLSGCIPDTFCSFFFFFSFVFFTVLGSSRFLMRFTMFQYSLVQEKCSMFYFLVFFLEIESPGTDCTVVNDAIGNHITYFMCFRCRKKMHWTAFGVNWLLKQ